MILRRLSRSARRQDWLAVAIEFVIVVAGIFVGLQVTQWNEERQSRERELNYLMRLREDLTAMSAEFGEIRSRADDPGPRALRAFRALEACDAGPASAEDIERTLAGYQNQPIASIVERTYQEMVSSGALAAMDDRALSGEIAALFSALYNYRNFVSNIRISLPVVDEVLWRHVDLSYDVEGRPVLVAFDIDSACRSREVKNAVWEIYDLFWDWEQVTMRTARSVEALGDRLDAYLSRSAD